MSCHKTEGRAGPSTLASEGARKRSDARKEHNEAQPSQRDPQRQLQHLLRLLKLHAPLALKSQAEDETQEEEGDNDKRNEQKS
eukprot:768629-Hanusia_phi.AAC.7